MEVAGSEMSISTYMLPWHHNPKNDNMNNYYYENLKIYMQYLIWDVSMFYSVRTTYSVPYASWRNVQTTFTTIRKHANGYTIHNQGFLSHFKSQGHGNSDYNCRNVGLPPPSSCLVPKADELQCKCYTFSSYTSALLYWKLNNAYSTSTEVWS
jgi:hypothetical protein